MGRAFPRGGTVTPEARRGTITRPEKMGEDVGLELAKEDAVCGRDRAPELDPPAIIPPELLRCGIFLVSSKSRSGSVPFVSSEAETSVSSVVSELSESSIGVSGLDPFRLIGEGEEEARPRWLGGVAELCRAKPGDRLAVPHTG